MRRRIATAAALLTSFCLLTACEKTPAVSNPSSIGGESVNVNSMGRTTGTLDLETLLDKETELLKRVNNTDSYQSLITTPVDIDIFVDTFDSNPFRAFNGRKIYISQVAEAIGLECLRQKPDGTLYSVHKVSQGGLLYIFYEPGRKDKLSYLRTWYYVKKPLSYSDFQGIKEGADMQKVKKVDPAASVYIDRLNRFGGEKEGTLLSDHYLQDGILRYGYEKVNGRFVIVGMRFDPDFRAFSYGVAVDAREKIIDGQVYPMDREGL